MRTSQPTGLLLIIALFFLGACAPATVPRTASAPVSPTITIPARPPTEPTSTPMITLPPKPPPTTIAIALDYVGIRNTHWISQMGGTDKAKVQLIIIIRDDTGTLATWPPDPQSQTFPIDFFQVISLKDFMGGTTVLYKGPVTGTLSMRVVANNVNKGAISKAQIDFIRAFGGGDLTALKALIPDEELIGTYWQTWLPTNNWGIGSQYNNDNPQDNVDLRIWGRIGLMNQMPPELPKPILKPNVEIQSVTLPSGAKKSIGPYVFTYYDTTFRLVNNESFDVTVNWQANSSATGNYDSGSIIVPKNSFVDVRRRYYYSTAGAIKIDYSIFYRGNEIHSLSGTLIVSP